MSVVGFDIGNLNSYIAVARQGGVETATNDYSQRATPSCVSFGSKSRCMGVAARQQIATNLKNTVLSFKHLIGRKFSDPVVQHERKWLPCELVELPENTIGIKVMYLNETRVFTPEQVLAILLTKLKELSEQYLKTKVSDCVISVPCYWTDAQRRAMLDAAKISDLNCLRIINDTTATALSYGIYKQDLPEETEKSRRIVFVDMGYSATQISLCAFNKGKLKVLGNVWDLSLGGRDFDAVLYDYFNNEFKSKYKIDASTSSRHRFRLFDECEKIKKQMSANSNPIPLGIECFMNDKDVHCVVKRSDFEAMSIHLYERLSTLLQKLITENKIKAADVDFVELIGGSTRMPMIRQIVQQIFGKEPCTTLNQDEAVSRGCALQCAILSPTFRVREFNITDAQPFAIKLTWKAVSGLDEGEMDVFGENHAFPFSKILTFYRKEPFTLEACYAYPNHIPYSSTFIGKFLVNNVVPGLDGDNSKVKVKVRINGNGLFAVTSASLYESQQKTEDDDAEGGVNGDSVDQPSNLAGEAGGEQAADKAKVPETGGQEPMQTDAGQNNGDASAGLTDGATANQPNKTTKAKVKVKCVDLPINECVVQMSEADIQKFRSMEIELQKQDRLEREKADAKNALEEYVYEMRDKLSDRLSEFVTEKDKSTFMAQLETIANWLYEDGDDETKEVYVNKLSNLKTIGEPICERYQEAQERPLAFEEFGRFMQMVRKFCELYDAKDPKYEHIDSVDVDKVRKALSEKQAWFDKQCNQQSRRPLTEPPVVFASQIRAEKDALDRVVWPIMHKPKPKVELPPEPAKTSADASKPSQQANGPAAADLKTQPPAESAAMDVE